MIKISTFFENKIIAGDLIFRDKDNKGVNLIYYPELGSSGIDFANKYRKKNYWDYFIIPNAFMFMSHKTLTNGYFKDFKKAIPMVRTQRKFAKSSNQMKSVVIDLTPLSPNFTSFCKSRSKKMTTEAFIELVEQFAVDSAKTEKECYVIVDNQTGTEHEMVSALQYYSRLNGNKIRIKGIEGIVVYGNKRYWPLTIKETDKDGVFLKINVGVYSRYMKDVHGIEEVEEVKPEDQVRETKEMVKALYQVHQDTLKSSTVNISGTAKAASDIEENPLELIKNEVTRNKHIKGKTFEEKLSNLFKEPGEDGKRENNSNIKTSKVVNEISDGLKKLNRDHNGSVELDESTILRNRKSFYNPLDVIGFNEFHGYNKQETEFGETLDQSIHDLIKGMEKDTDLGIKVKSIKTEITDTHRDRYKTYRIKIQHKEFGHGKPYTISFHVPVPAKGKYLKLGGNDYIMINQFSPKPVVKVSADTVRLYTHYSTAAVSLKTHSLNADQDVKQLIDGFATDLKRSKKLNKPPEKMEASKVQAIVEKYDLPDFINNEVFVNLEIK